MIHFFKTLDNYFLFDVESGTLTQIDKLTFGELNKLNKEELESGNIITAIDQEVFEELMILKERNSLFVKFEEDFNIELKTGYIKALCLNVCHECNMECVYCFAKENNKQNNYMTIDIAKKAINFLILNSGNYKTLEVDFFGGEPLLNINVIYETIKFARSLEAKYNKKFNFTITSNALLLTDDLINFFNKEMFNVVISIDGREKVHNLLRKTKNHKDSFSLILDNVKNFIKKRGDKSYYIRGTFTALNPDFSNDVEYLASLNAKNISLEPVVTDECNLSINNNNIESILSEYELLAKKILENKYDFEFFHFNCDFEQGACLKKRIIGCSAGNEYLAISPNGELYPCHQFVGKQQFCLGNLNKCTFLEDLKQNIINEFCSVSLNSKPSCKKCFAKYYCSGGCMALGYKRYGDINEIDDISCKILKKRFEIALALSALRGSFLTKKYK